MLTISRIFPSLWTFMETFNWSSFVNGAYSCVSEYSPRKTPWSNFPSSDVSIHALKSNFIQWNSDKGRTCNFENEIFKNKYCTSTSFHHGKQQRHTSDRRRRTSSLYYSKLRSWIRALLFRFFPPPSRDLDFSPRIPGHELFTIKIQCRNWKLTSQIFWIEKRG